MTVIKKALAPQSKRLLVFLAGEVRQGRRVQPAGIRGQHMLQKLDTFQKTLVVNPTIQRDVIDSVLFTYRLQILERHAVRCMPAAQTVGDPRRVFFQQDHQIELYSSISPARTDARAFVLFTERLRGQEISIDKATLLAYFTAKSIYCA